MRRLYRLLPALLATLLAGPAGASSQGESVNLVVEAGRPLRVALEQRLRVKRTGQPVVATLVEAVYAYDRIVIPAGTKVVGCIERLGRVSADRKSVV